MKNPNGFGSVYKLSGKRRKPWVARKTIGFNEKGHPVYDYIGYYETRTDAFSALASYNSNPTSFIGGTITMQEVYDRYTREHFELISFKSIQAYKSAWKLCEKIKDKPIKDVHLDQLQTIVDYSGKNTPTLKRLKILLGGMYDYAVVHEYIEPAKREYIRYLDISKPGNPNSRDRVPFTVDEVRTLWDVEKSNEYVSVILMLIYSGLRISEMLDLKKEDVHIDEQWFYVRQSKTESGIREVPIADKVLPLFKRWYDRKCDYLICTPENQKMQYANYKDAYWVPILDQLGIGKDHTPHSARYTCISLMTVAGVDERILKKIVGHKGQNVTEAVYTHIELPFKLEAINRIEVIVDGQTSSKGKV